MTFKFCDIVKITRRGKGKKIKSNLLTKAIAKQKAIEDMRKEKLNLNFN